MANQCNNCGAELFVGQLFCRTCGKPTQTLSANEMPTQALPPKAQPGAPARTSPLSGSTTADFYPPPPTGSYPSVHVPPGAVAGHAGQPRRRRSKIVWAVLAVLFALVCIGAFAALNDDPPRRVVVKRKEAKQAPAPPTLPKAGGISGATLAEDGAQETDNETILKKTYALATGATVVLKNVSGSIKVEGWDEQRAEVKITKRGGTREQRRDVSIIEDSGDRNLSLERPIEGDSPVEVDYEVRLPRSLKSVEIRSMRSDVELSGVEGDIRVDLKQGDIELEGVAGVFDLKTMHGETRVEVKELRGDGASKITSMAGDVVLGFEGAPNIELKAKTLAGDIELDNDLGLKVEKGMVGESVAGRVGEGKHPVTIEAMAGDIKITR
ncbi:MAG TPA: DUF4097 family beta strand repeat-containing protein [Pyrinomonadaceae bacterium]|nr:DUF4097 family beta strand repeat-containing protein [Pyrinomonadaceae bacterium]